MHKPLLVALLTATIVFGFGLVNILHFGIVHASTENSDIPKPSIPEFTVELIDSSYDVPTTYSTDPYTGENVTHPGHHVESTSIEITFTNQPIEHFMIESYSISFYFNIRVKGHFSEDWGYPYSAYYGFIRQNSGSEYTIEVKENDYPSGGQVDFQAEAMIGYIRPPLDQFGSWFLVGEKSGWSETKTITVSALQTPTPEPTAQPELFPTTLVVASIATIIVIGIGLLVYFKKR